MYYVDHTAKHVQEQWVHTVDHDGKRTEVEEEDDYNEVQAVSFYPRTLPVKLLEWKALENRLKPSSIEPPKLELKKLPKHLEYTYLQENNQLLVVISFTLSTIKKARLLEVAPKKRGMTTVKNVKNKLIPQRTVTRWRVCIDYSKLNNATRKVHFPLSFIDQMLEHLVGHEYYCFLDEFSREGHVGSKLTQRTGFYTENKPKEEHSLPKSRIASLAIRVPLIDPTAKNENPMIEDIQWSRSKAQGERLRSLEASLPAYKYKASSLIEGHLLFFFSF
ncbi:hypothetical protein Tco_1151718 [Tanacetum coccineum]